MPVMNGIDAIKAIKVFDFEAKIVVCSAMGQQKVIALRLLKLELATSLLNSLEKIMLSNQLNECCIRINQQLT